MTDQERQHCDECIELKCAMSFQNQLVIWKQKTARVAQQASTKDSLGYDDVGNVTSYYTANLLSDP